MSMIKNIHVQIGDFIRVETEHDCVCGTIENITDEHIRFVRANKFVGSVVILIEDIIGIINLTNS